MRQQERMRSRWTGPKACGGPGLSVLCRSNLAGQKNLEIASMIGHLMCDALSRNGEMLLENGYSRLSDMHAPLAQASGRPFPCLQFNSAREH
jgi:hypothetical protein